MAFILTLDDAEHRAEVEETGPGRYRITLDGKDYDVDARQAGSIYSILVDGHVFEADLEPTGHNGDLSLMIRGAVYEVHAIDERRQKLRKAARQGATGGGVLKTPMPGKVVRILTPVGTKVKQGDGVIVVEAMKMENELPSPADGVVKEVRATEGQAVDGGAILAVIE